MNGQSTSPTNRFNLSNPSLQAAAQAAASINAQLAAEGKIQQQKHVDNAVQQERKKEKKIKTGRKDLFSSEVEINSLPPRVRNLLTKGYIQEQIQWKSKAALCTKGRYIAPRETVSTGSDRPLYICIQAVDKQAIEEAIHQIKQFIEEHTNGSSPPLPILNHPAPAPVVPLIKDKVYINLDQAPEIFGVVERVLGAAGDNVSFIQTETGVTVTLQGRSVTPSSDEPLHLLLEHIDAVSVQNARSLALSLVGTLQQDYVQWQQQQQQQFVTTHYTISQPWQGTTTTTTANYHYPMTMVYGMANTATDRNSLQFPPPSSYHTPMPSNNNSYKRPSRFDYHQTQQTATGTESAPQQQHSLAKRAKRPPPDGPYYHH